MTRVPIPKEVYERETHCTYTLNYLGVLARMWVPSPSEYNAPYYPTLADEGIGKKWVKSLEVVIRFNDRSLVNGHLRCREVLVRKPLLCGRKRLRDSWVCIWKARWYRQKIYRMVCHLLHELLQYGLRRFHSQGYQEYRQASRTVQKQWYLPLESLEPAH